MFSSNTSQVAASSGGTAATLAWSTTDPTGTATNSNTVWTGGSSSSYSNTRAELPSSGLHYFEVATSGTIDNNASIGLMSMNNTPVFDSAFWDSSNCTHRLIRRGNGSGANFQEADNGDGNLSGDNTSSHSLISWGTTSVVFMVAWDANNKRAWMGINGTWINNQTPSSSSATGAQIWSSVTNQRVGIAASTYTQGVFTIRAPGSHSYSAPSGFTAGGAGSGGGGGGGGGGSNTLQYKYGSCPGGTSMSGITYSGLAYGPTTLTLGTAASFTGTSGDRCVVIDLGGTVSNSNTTATQNGSNYFSVWTSTDGSSWTQRVAYNSVGSSSSYTYSLSSTSHRYVAYTSGESGSIFNSIKVNSFS